MYLSKIIYDDVKELIHFYDSKDPKKILSEKKVITLPFKTDTTLLGMYKKIEKYDFVFINPKLDEINTRMVLAHELGHIIYHALNTDLCSSNFLNSADKKEIEANIFAAHLLLDDTSILEMVKEGYTFYEIAQANYVNPHLAIIKLNELKKLGFSIPVEYEFNPNFFKDINGKNKENWNKIFINEDFDKYGGM